MVSEFELRRYRSADKNQVWEVHDQALRASMPEYSPEYNRYLRHIEERFLDVGGEFLVAADADDIVAIGGYQPFTVLDPVDCGPADVSVEEAVRVRSVAVNPEHQSRGIGTELMTELETRAAESGFQHIVLQTTASLERSHGFYESLGYQQAGTTNDGAAVWFRKAVTGFETNQS